MTLVRTFFYTHNDRNIHNFDILRKSFIRQNYGLYIQQAASHTHSPTMPKFYKDKWYDNNTVKCFTGNPSCTTCKYYMNTINLCERFYVDAKICRLDQTKCGYFAYYWISKV